MNRVRLQLVNIAPLVVALLLSACTTSSGVRLAGPDTYEVAAAATAGKDPVELEAIMKTQATSFCSQSQRKVEVLKTVPPKTGIVREQTSMTFKCVPPG